MERRVFVWQVIGDIQFATFKVPYSSSAYIVRFSQLKRHLSSLHLVFQNSPLEFSYLENTKTNGNTHLFGQPLLLEVFDPQTNLNYIAVLTPTFHEDPTQYVAYYSRMRLFRKFSYDLNFEIYGTIDAVMKRCIQLTSEENVELTESTITNINSSAVQHTFGVFSASNQKTYWLYIPEENESLLHEIESRQIPDDYLLLFLNGGATKKCDIINKSSALLEFHYGIARPFLREQCNLL